MAEITQLLMCLRSFPLQFAGQAICCLHGFVGELHWLGDVASICFLPSLQTNSTQSAEFQRHEKMMKSQNALKVGRLLLLMWVRRSAFSFQAIGGFGPLAAFPSVS